MSTTSLLDRYENFLDTYIPENSLQNTLHEYSEKIATEYAKFLDEFFQSASMKDFTKWTYTVGNGHLIKEFAVHLAKLPLREGRNLLELFFNCTKEVLAFTLYGVSHPLLLPSGILKELSAFLSETKKLIKVGSSLVGVSAGTAIISSFSPLILMLGGLFLFAGISKRVLYDSISEEDLAHLLLQGIEAFETGLFFGAAVGGIKLFFSK